jgi:methyl-accepting chemotaxis protein
MQEESLMQSRVLDFYKQQNQEVAYRTDRLFGGLMLGQWLFAIMISLLYTPRTWAGETSSIHPHVIAALGLGGLLTIPTVALVWSYPGKYANRFLTATAQLMMSSLLIHLTGGTIETHFHIFGSLAFVAFYRDWRALIPATLWTAADHFVRGIYFPMSIFGVEYSSLWRILEHVGWVLFEDGFLVYSCIKSQQDMLGFSQQRANEIERAELQEAESAKEMEAMVKLLQQIDRAGIQVTGASTSLAATANQQESSISEQASAATEISATSRQIAATARELVVTMDEVASGAEDTAGLASQGRGLLGKMQRTIDSNVSAVSNISAKLAVLNEKANKISTVVTTIAKVADQTNLLSLNAAIEAERAGEYGRGFGVVAVEIRRLADQTAVSTLDIEQMIREVQSAASSGVMGMDKFSEEIRSGAEAVSGLIEQLSQITSRVEFMSERFEQVNGGMKSQAVAAEQIMEAIGQLSESTQETAISIRNFSTVISNLREATRNLATTTAGYRSQRGVTQEATDA